MAEGKDLHKKYSGRELNERGCKLNSAAAARARRLSALWRCSQATGDKLRVALLMHIFPAVKRRYSNMALIIYLAKLRDYIDLLVFVQK